MLLHEINFPVYCIKNYRKLWKEDNIQYVDTERDTYIIDNRNLNGDTLGKRRLHIKSKKAFPLKLPIFTIKQLIQRTSSTSKTFIDSSGELFHYKKSIYVPLKYHKIVRVEQGTSKYYIFIKDLSSPLVFEGKHNLHNLYAGVLYTEVGLIPYELCEEKKTNTRRMI